MCCSLVVDRRNNRPRVSKKRKGTVEKTALTTTSGSTPSIKEYFEEDREDMDDKQLSGGAWDKSETDPGTGDVPCLSSFWSSSLSKEVKSTPEHCSSLNVPSATI